MPTSPAKTRYFQALVDEFDEAETDEDIIRIEAAWLKHHSCSCGLLQIPCSHDK